MDYWFTADTHFSHANIIKYCHRPFITIQDHDETLIHNWNSLIKNDDVVYHLGDFCFGRSDSDFYVHFRRLRGKIILVKGNHDKLAFENRDAFYSWADSYKEIAIGEQKITLCHYPLLIWRCKHYGAIMLHGHCHYSLFTSQKGAKGIGKILDVGVDGNDFKPYSYEEILKIMNEKPMFSEKEQFNDRHLE